MTVDTKDALRKAATVIQALERRIQAADAARTEPIAIIGAGCRLPGGVRDLDGFGALLRAGTDAIGMVPPERFDVAAFYDPDPGAPGKIYTREAAFLDAVDRFDPEFFGISPREAVWLDPQHRLVLECAWEALDDAGAPADQLRNANVGVYLGIGLSDYEERRIMNPRDALDVYAATGIGSCFSAGRLSFLLGLHGPAVALDTACSSSLVALHLACQALRAGECELALAGGVLLMLSPGPFLLLSRLRALAPDGRCKSFSDRADGYGRGEGCGMVVLKRLSDARRDGDRVLALIRGSAINHDGPSSGFIAPNGSAQRQVIRQALASAGLAPAEVDYVEAHGTGTPLGDPIEIEALAAVYGKDRARPLDVGTVKSNIGHLEWAAGVAGVLKIMSSLRDSVLPPSLHAERLNPAVDWAGLPLRIVREAQPWPAGERVRRAGVSSFGMSGTNAHVILEEAPPRTPPAAPSRPVELVTLSARTPAALEAVAGRLRAHLGGHPALALGDLAFSLATARAHHPHRRAIVAASREELVAALDGGLGVHGAPRARRGKLAFLFTGQGAQVAGMGRELHAAWPAFRDAWDRCAALFDRQLPRPLGDVAWAVDGAALDQTAYTQPALFAFEYAMCALWRSFGIDPDLLAGHSIGELVAACVAGVFSLEDAVTLVAARARLMQALPPGGAMVAVEASEAEVAAALAAVTGPRVVSLAAVNGPRAVVVSGDEAQVTALAEGLAARGLRTTRLRVSHAFHSPLVEPMLAELERVAQTITYHAPDRPIVSNVTGASAGGELATAAYWVRHVRAAVRFGDSVRALAAAGTTTFVEVGPKPTLLALVAAGLEGGPPPVLVPSQGGGRAAPAALLAAVGTWYAHGGAVDWRGVFPDGGSRVPLPSYPWQRSRYWIELAARDAPGIGRVGRWPLSGIELRLPGGAWHHVLAIGPHRPAFLADHVVYDKVLVAGAFHIAVILAIAAEHWPGRPLELTGVDFLRARSLEAGEPGEPSEAGEPIELHAILAPEPDGEARSFEIQTVGADGRTTIHVRGRVQPTAARPGHVDGRAARATTRVEPAQILARLAEMRVAWGPRWRWITEAHLGPDISVATLAPSYPGAHAVAPLHPALLDNAFATSLLASLLAPGDGTARLPFAVDRLRWFRAPTGAVRTVGVPQGGVDVSDFVLIGEDDGVVAEVQGLACRAAPLDKLMARAPSAAPAAPAAVREGDEGDEFLELAWPAEAVAPPRVAAGRWLVVGGGALGAALAAALVEAGHRAAQVAAFADAFDGAAPTAIVHLGSLDAPEAFGGAAVEAALVTGCDSVLATVQALARQGASDAPRLWLVTRGAQAVAAGPIAIAQAVAVGPIAIAQAPLIGLGRVIAVEHPELRCTRVDLDPARPAGELAALVAELAGDGADEEVALRGETRHVARLVHRLPEASAERREPAGDRAYRLEITEPGVFDGLVLRVAERRSPGPGEVEIAVEATSLNFVAVLLALGVMPANAPGVGGGDGPVIAPGGDCAGRVVAVGPGVTDLVAGQPVVVLASRGAFGSHITIPATLVLPVPASLSMAEAAALPVAYLTAWYGLERVARLGRGERVLIHSAAGGVGLAAVQWAQHVGAEIYATAGTPEKRAYLASLGVPYVSDSRSNQFVADVRAWTGGEGVDVVLNSLAGDAIANSFDLLRPYGRFIEIGKRDYYENQPLGLRPFLRNLSFSLVDLLAMMAERPAWVRELFAELLGLVEAGVFTPPPIALTPISRVAEAFRAMARGLHMGKLVITQPDPAVEVHVRAEHAVPVRADGSYLITGGLGGLGLGVAGWLAERGAGHVVLIGRSAPASATQLAAIEAMRARGTRVTAVQADIAERAAVQQVIEAAAAIAPVRGVVHAAGVLDDALVLQQTPAKLRGVMAPKVHGALHLHELLRHAALDFFVLYSSGAGLLGSPGQSNYAAANAFLDALAHHRRAQGLPALSIDWGAFAEVGMAAVHDNRAARLASQGMRSLLPAEGLRALERLLATDRTQVGVIPLDPRRWVEANPAAATSRMWSALVAAHGPARAQGADLQSRLAAAPPEARAAIVRDIIRAQVARVLQIPEAKLDPDVAFTSLGMDSLTGLELRNRLGAELRLQLPGTLIFQHPTIAAVTDFALGALVRAAVTFDGGGDGAPDEEEGTL
jgi:acyl transferase domain-containing protein